MSESGLVRVAGLWKRTSKGSGQNYFAGRLGPFELLVFENEERDAKAPALVLYVKPGRRPKEKPASGEDDPEQIPF